MFLIGYFLFDILHLSGIRKRHSLLNMTTTKGGGFNDYNKKAVKQNEKTTSHMGLQVGIAKISDQHANQE